MTIFDRAPHVAGAGRLQLRVFTTVLGIGAAILMGGVGWHLLMTPLPTPDQQRLELQQQRLELQARQQQLARDHSWDAWTTAAGKVFEITFFFALSTAAVLGLVGAGAHLHRQGTVWWAKRDGRVPIHRDALTPEFSTAATASHHQILARRAEHPALPRGIQNVTWAPRVHGVTAAVPEVPEVRVSAEGKPVWAQLIGSGEIGHRLDLYLGKGVEGPLRGTLHEHLGSVGFGGKPNKGKSWAAVCYACQVGYQGGRFLISDQHAGSSESLANRLLPLSPLFLEEPARTPQETLKLVRRAVVELDRRRACLCQASPSQRCPNCSWPLVAIVDEWTSLVIRSGSAGTTDELLHCIKLLGVDGRKYGVYVWLLAQCWSARDLGDSSTRSPLTSLLVFNMRPNEAEMMTGYPQSRFVDALGLGQGECLIFDMKTGTPTRVNLPLMTQSDVSEVARRVVAGPPAEVRPGGCLRLPAPATGLPPRLLAKAWQGSAGGRQGAGRSSAGALAGVTDDEILELFRQGYDFSGVVKQLAGTGDGRRYTTARKAVEAVLLERALGIPAREDDEDVLLLEVVGRDDEDGIDATGAAVDERRVP